MNPNIKILLIVFFMALAVLTFTIINYYQVKYIQEDIKAILLYQTRLLPLIILFSMIVAVTFNMGTRIFSERIWVPALLYFSFEVIFAGACAYFFFKEVPVKGTLVGGILVIIGSLLAIIWK